MSSASKGKGSVKTIDWAKHLRPFGKRKQNKLVRRSAKNLLEEFEEEEMQDPQDAISDHFEEKED